MNHIHGTFLDPTSRMCGLGIKQRIELDPVMAPKFEVEFKPMPDGGKLGFFDKRNWVPITIHNDRTGRPELILVKKSNLKDHLKAIGLDDTQISSIIDRPEFLTERISIYFATKFSKQFFGDGPIDRGLVQIFHRFVNKEIPPLSFPHAGRTFIYSKPNWSELKAGTVADSHLLEEGRRVLDEGKRAIQAALDIYRDMTDDLADLDVALRPDPRMFQKGYVPKEKPKPKLTHSEPTAGAGTQRAELPLRGQETPRPKVPMGGLPELSQTGAAAAGGGPRDSATEFQELFVRTMTAGGMPQIDARYVSTIIFPRAVRFENLDKSETVENFSIDFGSRQKLTGEVKTNLAFPSSINVTIQIANPLRIRSSSTDHSINFEPGQVTASVFLGSDSLKSISYSGNPDVPFHLETHGGRANNFTLAQMQDLFGSGYKRA